MISPPNLNQQHWGANCLCPPPPPLNPLLIVPTIIFATSSLTCADAVEVKVLVPAGGDEPLVVVVHHDVGHTSLLVGVVYALAVHP